MDFALVLSMQLPAHLSWTLVFAMLVAPLAAWAHAPMHPLRLRHVHRDAELSVQLVDTHGQIQPRALTQLRAFLACHKTGADHPIHWRLAAMLVGIAQRWPGRVIQVHSGYRHPSVSHHATRSNHTRGRAIDIRIPGVPNRVLFDTLRHSFSAVGLGYYPNSAFVHLDVRARKALWVDYAGPNHKACYSPTPIEDLSSGAAEALSESQARARGCR